MSTSTPTYTYSKQRVLDEINAANNTGFTLAQVDLAAPVVNTDPPARNTKVVASPISGTLTGQQTFYYNRLSLGIQFAGVDRSFVKAAEQTTLYDLLPLLSSRFGMPFEPVDFVDAPLNLTGPAPWLQTLQAAPDSYAYLGSVGLLLLQGVSMYAYNQSLGGLMPADLQDEEWVDNNSFALYTDPSLDMRLGLRPLLYTATGDWPELIDSDASNVYNFEMAGDGQWWLIIALEGGDVLSEVQAGHIRIRVQNADVDLLIPVTDTGTQYSTTYSLGSSSTVGTSTRLSDDSSAVLWMYFNPDPSVFPSLTANSTGSFYGDWTFSVQVLDDVGAVVHELSVDMHATAPVQDFTAHESPSASGMNGAFYFMDGSTTPAMTTGMFTSVDPDMGTGYQISPLNYAKLVDDQLLVDVNFSGYGYASGYTGTMGIELYACDPGTGAIVQTYTLSSVTWDYLTQQYTIADLPTIDGTHVWRGKLTVALTDGSNPINRVVDLSVLTSDTYTLVSIDGTTVNAALVVDTGSPVLRSPDTSPTAVVYRPDAGATLPDITDGDHTAVINIGGVDTTLSFTMQSF